MAVGRNSRAGHVAREHEVSAEPSGLVRAQRGEVAAEDEPRSRKDLLADAYGLPRRLQVPRED